MTKGFPSYKRTFFPCNHFFHESVTKADPTFKTAFAGFSFRSVQSLDRLGRRGDMKNDVAKILFQSFLQEALVSSSGMGRDVHSWMLPFSISSADH